MRARASARARVCVCVCVYLVTYKEVRDRSIWRFSITIF